MGVKNKDRQRPPLEPEAIAAELDNLRQQAQTITATIAALEQLCAIRGRAPVIDIARYLRGQGEAA